MSDPAAGPMSSADSRSVEPATRWSGAARLPQLTPYVISAIFVAAAALVSDLTVHISSAAGLTLFFLVAVVISAHRYGLWPAVFTSVLSVLCWDFFFTLPYYSLYLDDPRDFFTLITFLSASLLISGTTDRIRRQNERLTALAKSVSDLYRLSQEISQLATVEDLAKFAVAHVEHAVRCNAVIVLRDHAERSARLVFPRDRSLGPREIAAADGMNRDPRTWSGAERGAGARYLFLPLNTPHGTIGSMGISRPGTPKLTLEERRELDVFLNMTALAIERAWLAYDIEHAQMTAETERLRNALLTSVSHDLRTPLTTIIGALSTLETVGHSISSEEQGELLASAHSEADRLNRFVGNLLDVTKLESGSLKARLVPTDLMEVTGLAVERARSLLAHHVVRMEIPNDLPAVRADATMLEQVIFNVLDNAAKYSAANSEIRIAARADAPFVILEIADQGEGFPEGADAALFEKFTRFAQGDTKAPGTGLGLMICRGFLQTMDGTITAANRIDGAGAVITIRLRCVNSVDD